MVPCMNCFLRSSIGCRGLAVVKSLREVIMVDPAHKAIKDDPRINWLCNPTHKHREMRGLTSAGRKYRGLHGKGHNFTKSRPSKRATWRNNNRLSYRRYR